MVHTLFKPASNNRSRGGKSHRSISNVNKLDHYRIDKTNLEGVNDISAFTALRSLYYGQSVSLKQMLNVPSINHRGSIKVPFEKAVLTHFSQVPCKVELLGYEAPQLPAPTIFNNNYLNSMWALQGRHFATRLSPDRECVKEFSEFVKTKIVEWSPKFSEFLKSTNFSMEAYIAHVPDSKKRKEYALSYEDLKTFGKVPSTFKCEMKTNETLFQEVENGKPKALRPRNLFNPPT